MRYQCIATEYVDLQDLNGEPRTVGEAESRAEATAILKEYREEFGNKRTLTRVKDTQPLLPQVWSATDPTTGHPAYLATEPVASKPVPHITLNKKPKPTVAHRTAKQKPVAPDQFDDTDDELDNEIEEDELEFDLEEETVTVMA